MSLNTKCLLLILFIFGIESSHAQIERIPVVEHHLNVLGIFHKNAAVIKEVFNTSLRMTPSDGKISLEAITVTPDAFDSYSVWRAMCTAADSLPLVVYGPQIPYAGVAVEDACRITGIPHFQATWIPPDPELDLTSPPISPTLNLYPDADDLAIATAKLLDYYSWTSFTILYEDDLGLIRVQKLLAARETNDGEITIRQLSPNGNNRPIFKELNGMHESRVLLDCHVDNIKEYFREAGNVDMLNEYQSYIIPNLEAHSLNWADIEDLKANVTWLSMISLQDRKMPNDELSKYVKIWNEVSSEPITAREARLEAVLTHDLAGHLMESISAANRDGEINFETERPQKLCSSYERLQTRPKLLEYMIMTKSSGFSGPILFDEWGRRVNYSLFVIEMENGQSAESVAVWDSQTKELQDERIFNTAKESFSSKKNHKHFKVISRLAEPYLKYKVPQPGEVLTGNDKFEGYSLNLMEEIFKTLNNEGKNYTFEFLELDDNSTSYGTFDKETKQWNGLIGQLLAKKADFAVCDLTITEERRKVVDFSVPFMTLGISILFKKEMKEEIKTFSFLTPFSVEVWLYTATSYLVVSIILFVSARISPPDWENPQPCEKEPEELENIWNFKNCTWLTMGSIMTQGCDILPKGSGSRWVCGMWWFFTLIVVQTYIAQLAASLTTNRQETPIKNVEDLAKQNKVQYGVLQGGSTARFFETSPNPLYSKMWDVMVASRPSVFTKSSDEGAQRVRKGKGLYAFFMESITIEYMMRRDCELMQIGGLLDTKDYGIAMPANSPFRSDINWAILELQQSEKLNNIKKTWWSERFNAIDCTTKSRGDVEGDLEIENLMGAFIVLGAGCAIAVVIGCIEFTIQCRDISINEQVPLKQALFEEFKASLNLTQLEKPVLKKGSCPSSPESSSRSRSRSRSRAVSMLRTAAASFINLEKQFK